MRIKKQTNISQKWTNTLTVLQNWFQNYNILPFSRENAFYTVKLFYERLFVVMTLGFAESRHLKSLQENDIFCFAFYENIQLCEMEIFIQYFNIKQPETSEL